MNKCILMGRLTRDPILRHTQTNTPVTSFTLAVDRFGKSGEQKKADFIDIVCWEKLAEFTSKYFVKGQLVAVVGRLQQRQWVDKEGNNRTSYEIVASEAHFAERRQPNNEYAPAPYTQQQQQPMQPGGGYAPYAPPSPESHYTPYAPPQPEPSHTSPPHLTDSTGFSELIDDDGELPF